MLSSLTASLPDGLSYELILADDGSTDGTRDWLRDLDDPRIQKVLNPHNLGYAKTNNTAAARAKGEYLGLLNNDLVFKPGWLEPMLAALRDPALNAGIVGNLQFRVADHALDHAGVVLTPRGQFDHLRFEQDDPTKPARVYVATGACMLMRKADFDALGGFDEVFVNGCEDIDLCLKMRAAGKEIYVAPSSRILHHVSLSRSRTSLQNERNSQYLYAKWRKEIKLQLIKCWVALLAEGPSAYEPYIDGQLTRSFLASPHMAAITLAEAALLREEARWASALDTPAVNGDWPSHVTLTGVAEASRGADYVAGSAFTMDIDQLKTACNFYVCGRLPPDVDASAVEITLCVNGIQEKTFRLSNDQNINVGLVQPVLKPRLNNRFSIQLKGINIEPSLLLHHFVIDDRVIKVEAWMCR